jgi:hypothetical protein
MEMIMTVQFRENPSTHDHLLGPVLSRNRGPASSVLLAVLVKGLVNGMEPEDIRLWIKSRSTEGTYQARVNVKLSQQESDEQPHGSDDGPALRPSPSLHDLINSGQLWRHFCKAAERKVLSSPSVTGDVRASHRSTARKLYAALLLPLPHSEGLLLKRNINARVALAHVALTLLSDTKGWDSAIYTQPRLAAATGWSARTAWTSLKDLEDIGVLRRLSKDGTTGRFRLAELNGERRDGIRDFSESIDAFVDEEPDVIGDIIRGVTHPAWSHSATLNHGHWLTLLSDAAAVPVTNLRMRRVIELPLRATMTSLHLKPVVVLPFLPQILDRLADDPEHGPVDPLTGARRTARNAHDLSLATYAEGAKARGAAAVKHKEMTRNTYEVLDELLTEHRIPKAPHLGSPRTEQARTERFDDWTESMREEILAGNANATFKSFVGVALLKILRKRGYGPAFSGDTVRYIMHGNNFVEMEAS